MTDLLTAERERLIRRFFELKPIAQKRFELLHARLPDGLRSVTVHQFGILLRLASGERTMREVAREASVSESAATAVTDRLAKQGLVERRHDLVDRRVVRVSLSERGAAMVEEFRDTACTQTALALSVLDDGQLEALVDVFETLATAPAPESDS
ncbi:MAG TPA: MarR family transcriptional regulator [Acidimicrobiales bacterium]|nr:MarR family transcriptional regulator [Acidimicrobiales bacterium]